MGVCCIPWRRLRLCGPVQSPFIDEMNLLVWHPTTAYKTRMSSLPVDHGRTLAPEAEAPKRTFFFALRFSEVAVPPENFLDRNHGCFSSLRSDLFV